MSWRLQMVQEQHNFRGISVVVEELWLEQVTSVEHVEQGGELRTKHSLRVKECMVLKQMEELSYHLE
jgi:hypothetical protein